ncbi:MAG: bifunctional serine/threonine-protein kinase/formylglycine-generating enzyme family protein [Planctomycetota bacterium]
MTTDDPDETPTRMGGSDPRRGGDAPDEERTASSMRPEDRTVPSKWPNGAPKQPARSADKPANRDSLIGKELGGCRIDSLLGRGAMGAVYKARQTRLDRDVAIKIIRPEMMTDPRMLKRFEVEARIVGQFNSPHVVMVHDVGFGLEVHFLVMEFVQGKNLREHVKLLAGGRLPAGEAIPLLRQACKGLEEAQRLGVIHRDIKPDNLMLTDRGVLKIADFGIAKPVEDGFNMTLTSELIGTPLYMSPEQCRGGEDLDFRSDMYSLGATFYYLLTGEPPIRASSVYELIQTKTKLENLCLWKALPELSENHPLSRVIERMTALDRQDRYDSYDGLLNDIVLVEQGSTIERIMKKPKAEASKPAVKKAKSRVLAVLAALVLVAAAGGGYWWSTRDTGGGGGGGTGTGNVPIDAQQVAAQLLNLRTRLVKDGPSSVLRGDVVKVVPDETHRTDTKNLLDDVDRGLPVLALLAALKKPASPESPFEDLRRYLGSVNDACKVEGIPGKELQQWLEATRNAKRAEEELGPKARSALQKKFSQWVDDRAKVETDKDELKRLGERLAEIRKGRQTLWDLLDKQRNDLDVALSTERLNEEKLGLANPTTRRIEVDAKLIASMRTQLINQGWDKALDEKANRQLDTTVPEQNQLITDIGKAKQAADGALGVYTNRKPKPPELPFDDVEGYMTTLRRALDPVGPTLPPWAERLLAERLAELWPEVKEACHAEFVALQGLGKVAGTDSKSLTRRLDRLRRGIDKAIELFGTAERGAERELNGLVPTEVLAAMSTAVAERARSNELLAAVKATWGTLDGVRSLGDWTAKEKSIGDRLEEHHKAVVGLGKDPEVDRELKECDSLGEQWKRAVSNLADCARKIAVGDLSGAIRVSADGGKGSEEIGLLRAVAQKCKFAFDRLDLQLEISQARDDLDAALLDLPKINIAREADDCIRKWSEALTALESAKGGMVRILSGTPRGSFFLSRFEARRSDYRGFLQQMQALLAEKGKANAKPEEQLEVLKARLGDHAPTADVLRKMLQKLDPQSSDDKPVDEVSYYEAAACAEWSHLSLPTKAEWALAAFGNAPVHTYPWGDDWKVTREYFNVSKELVGATQGGKSWRPGDSIHHLAGNVAEWLEAVGAGVSGELAGGSYRDNDAMNAVKDLAQGKEFTPARLSGNDLGFGFRLILRPRSFLKSKFPEVQFPQ